jgi:hypothetical protein
MTMPLVPNTTCDIYRSGNSPPAAPNVAAVACHLRADWGGGQDQGDRASLPVDLTWTHILLIDVAIDIRDGYAGGLSFMEQDSVYVPNQNGTKFKVVFVERVFRGQTQDHKRAYLDRFVSSWPTNEL